MISLFFTVLANLMETLLVFHDGHVANVHTAKKKEERINTTERVTRCVLWRVSNKTPNLQQSTFTSTMRSRMSWIMWQFSIRFLANLHEIAIVAVQISDPVISLVYKWKQSSISPAWTEISLINIDLKTYWSQWDRRELKDGILYRKWRDINLNTEVLQVVLPFSSQPEVFHR